MALLGSSRGSQLPFHPLEFPDSIRLLVLEPATKTDAPLHASLLHTRAKGKLSYEAISYTWGLPIFAAKLHLDKSLYSITENVSAALRRFRLADRPRTLWADSVCINQLDLAEKMHQISLMSNIYKGAERVLIWLGEGAEDEIGLAMDFMETLAKSHGYKSVCVSRDMHYWASSLSLKPYVDNVGAILQSATECRVHAIYEREWFTRLWVVQEITLAKAAIVYCGSRQLDWGTF